jgi:ribosomal protein S16
MFNPSRDQVRHFFFDTWSKYQCGEPLSALEQTALNAILMHPEYHVLLADSEHNRDRDFTPESGALNPFLHLSLHLAIEEQLSIDQPPGIRSCFEALVKKTGSEHDAKHEVLECLGETVWQAQRTGAPPDQERYLECLEKKAGRR